MSRITVVLQKLSTDPDVDVKQLAQAALSGQRLPVTFTEWGAKGAPWIK